MPGYRGHLAGGSVVYVILLYLLLSYCTSVKMAALWLLFALAGALFPDIDIKSKGQKYFYFLILGIYLMLIKYNSLEILAVISLFSVLPMLVKHRGLFHRLWFVIAFPGAIWFSLSVFYPNQSHAFLFSTIFFISGAISHLYLDLGLKRMLRL